MQSTAIITLNALPSAPTATEQALARRDELVLAAAGLKLVTTPESAQIAGDHLKALKQYLTNVETARKAVKQPVDDLASEIQLLAAALTAAPQEQKKRIDSMLANYQAEQLRKQREAEAEARREEQRILDEAAAKAAKAEASGRNVDAKLEKIDAKAFEQVATVRATVAAVAAPKIEGVGLRSEPDFEILDLHALYAAKPELVKLEVDRVALKSYLKKFPKAELPGVKHWVRNFTATRG
jgi:hypothetical protein